MKSEVTFVIQVKVPTDYTEPLDMPEVMDKANQALTYLASGQIPQNSNSYTALNNKKSEMVAFRNQSVIGILIVVIIGLLVF